MIEQPESCKQDEIVMSMAEYTEIQNNVSQLDFYRKKLSAYKEHTSDLQVEIIKLQMKKSVWMSLNILILLVILIGSIALLSTKEVRVGDVCLSCWGK